MTFMTSDMLSAKNIGDVKSEVFLLDFVTSTYL